MKASGCVVGLAWLLLVVRNRRHLLLGSSDTGWLALVMLTMPCTGRS